MIRRGAAIAPDKIIIPFEIGPSEIARARQIVFSKQGDIDRALALKNALFDPTQFGLRYSATSTKTAIETLKTREGNCFSLASVFVGLARAVGLRVYYLDASNVAKAMHQEQNAFLRVGHVSAVLETSTGRYPLDFGRQLILNRSYKVKVMDDLEALAHYHNNRGYDLVTEAQSKGRPVDWAAVRDSFIVAATIKPNFARAWNNLGVANARLGKPAEAETNYRTAIAKAPQFVSPYLNLGLLYLNTGKIDEAIQSLQTANHLDPKRPHIRQQLAYALQKRGGATEEVKALERPMHAEDEYSKTKTWLGQAHSQKQP